MICYIVSWWPSWLSDQIAFSNPESDVVWRDSRLSPRPPSWILELNYLAILNLYVTQMPPIKFWLNLTYCLEDVVWRISRWWPSWIWQQKILAILNFHNTPMPPSNFKLNQTYHSGADVIWRLSMWLPWWPSWISEWNHFRNSKFPCCPDDFHQVSSPSNTVREQLTIEDFQDGPHGGHHGYDSDGDVENVKCYWRTYGWGTDHSQQPTS